MSCNCRAMIFRTWGKHEEDRFWRGSYFCSDITTEHFANIFTYFESSYRVVFFTYLNGIKRFSIHRENRIFVAGNNFWACHSSKNHVIAPNLRFFAFGCNGYLSTKIRTLKKVILLMLPQDCKNYNSTHISHKNLILASKKLYILVLLFYRVS